VDVIVCSSTAAERVRQLADPAVQVMIDDRALDQRAIEMLASARKPGAARSALISADRSTRAQVSVPRRRHRRPPGTVPVVQSPDPPAAEGLRAG
jgi:hypothetical protein